MDAIDEAIAWVKRQRDRNRRLGNKLLREPRGPEEDRKMMRRFLAHDEDIRILANLYAIRAKYRTKE